MFNGAGKFRPFPKMHLYFYSRCNGNDMGKILCRSPRGQVIPLAPSWGRPWSRPFYSDAKRPNMLPFCKQNLQLFIQPRWQLRRTYFFNHYNVLRPIHFWPLWPSLSLTRPSLSSIYTLHITLLQFYKAITTSYRPNYRRRRKWHRALWVATHYSC